MPDLPQQEGKGQLRTKMFVSMLCTTNQHVLNIQLTDMWYLDISSLALTYIYLSRTTNNFGIDQLKMSSNKPISMVDILNKKSLVAKLSEVFSRIYRTKKGDFWTELIRPPLAPMQ